RLNIVLSRSGKVEAPPDVMKLSSKSEVLELAKYLNRDVFIIGGAEVFKNFADVIDKWFVTEVPLVIEDADTFMPTNFLDEFEVEETRELGDALHLEILHRR
ncbi:MAG: dihydrofolate reductase, partial [Pyrinomonadaceae bacterium]